MYIVNAYICTYVNVYYTCIIFMHKFRFIMCIAFTYRNLVNWGFLVIYQCTLNKRELNFQFKIIIYRVCLYVNIITYIHCVYLYACCSCIYLKHSIILLFLHPIYSYFYITVIFGLWIFAVLSFYICITITYV